MKITKEMIEYYMEQENLTNVVHNYIVKDNSDFVIFISHSSVIYVEKRVIEKVYKKGNKSKSKLARGWKR